MNRSALLKNGWLSNLLEILWDWSLKAWTSSCPTRCLHYSDYRRPAFNATFFLLASQSPYMVQHLSPALSTWKLHQKWKTHTRSEKFWVYFGRTSHDWVCESKRKTVISCCESKKPTSQSDGETVILGFFRWSRILPGDSLRREVEHRCQIQMPNLLSLKRQASKHSETFLLGKSSFLCLRNNENLTFLCTLAPTQPLEQRLMNRRTSATGKV
jgi:hypothetical protein